MQPFSSSPDAPSPRKKLQALRWSISTVATVVLVALFVGVFLALSSAPSTAQLASGPYTTPTPTAATTGTDPSTTTTPTTGSSTPEPGATQVPTSSASTPGTTTQTGAVRVTQNQDERQACLDDTAPYTVVLVNGGTVTASWYVSVAGYPNWATVKPQSGSIAPGQTTSFVMTVVSSMPCDGSMYKADVQLDFPAGTTQLDIPLTYAGTGPSRHSNVILVSGSLNMTQACPASGVAPDSYTFAIKNTGDGMAYPSVDNTKDTIGPKDWADIQIDREPVEPVTSWLYPGETMTVTISPHAGVHCDGTVYHIYVYINDTQGARSTMTFSLVFN